MIVFTLEKKYPSKQNKKNNEHSSTVFCVAFVMVKILLFKNNETVR